MKYLFFTVLSFFLVFSQNISVSGIVRYSEDVLVGANVVEKNTSNGTTTNSEGRFFLKIPKGAILVVSYVGFQNKEIAIDGEGGTAVRLDVELLEDVGRQDEVVVSGFSEIIGQARRRAETVQKIPESVVVFDANEIERKNVTDIPSFVDYIPNVNFTKSQNIGNNFITVRGISHIRNGESPVALVVDGVTLPDANLMDQELFDLASIEVVKGPQGALYGKNAIAGAINVFTKRATNVFYGKLKAGYGNGNLFNTSLSLTGPIMKNKLFYRLAGTYKKGDGLIQNETLNKPADYIDSYSFRGQVTAHLSDRVTATLTGQTTRTKGGATYYATPKSPGVSSFGPDDFDDQKIQGDQLGSSEFKSTYGNLKLSFLLEGLKLVSFTTYNKNSRYHEGDLDFIAFDILRQYQNSDSKIFNQELRLSTDNPDKKLTWDVGILYQKYDKLLFTKGDADVGFFVNPPAPTGTRTVIGTSDFTNTYTTFGAFGFADLKVSDKISFSAGLRYDSDNIKQDNRTIKTTPERTDAEIQPKVSVSYAANENALFFLNYGHGYRSGGFNQDSTVRFESGYKAETSDNYELGIKSSFVNNRLVINLSTYLINFDNQQLYALVVESGSFLLGNFNVPESKSFGFEADVKFRASKYFDILFSYGLSNSEIVKGISTESTAGNKKINVSGKKTPLVPQSSYTVGLVSSFTLSKNVLFNGNILLKNTGKIYWHEDNKASSEPYNLLDVNLGVSLDALDISLWGKNILDQKYITEFVGQTFSNGASDVAWKGNPRTFGLSVAYNL